MNLVSTALSWTRSLKGLQEQSRLKILDELRRILEVDTHEAVKIGDLEKNSEAIKVAGSKFDRHVPRRGGPRRGGRIDSWKR